VRPLLVRLAPLAVTLAAVAAVVLPYVALGGLSYEPAPVADPCDARPAQDPDDLQTVLEHIVLSALDSAACELEVSREDLVLAVRSEDALDDFADEHGVSRAEVERLVEEGLVQAIDDADEAGQLNGLLASLAKGAIENVPIWTLVEALERLRDLLP
jgi:hypothetical protein